MEFNELSLEELKVLAKSLEGFKPHQALGEVKYREAFKTFVDENPGCLENLKAPEDTHGSDETMEDDPVLLKKRISELEDVLKEGSEEFKLLQEKTVELEDEISVLSGDPIEEEKLPIDHKIKAAKVRGEVFSSVGVVDFGKTGIAECTAKQYKHFLQIEGYSKC